jgi:hypothetical protein
VDIDGLGLIGALNCVVIAGGRDRQQSSWEARKMDTRKYFTTITYNQPYSEIHCTQVDSVTPDGELKIKCSDISDGYHTMQELYQHRMALTAALTHVLNELAAGDFSVVVGKSRQHYDGTMFDGYFVVFIDARDEWPDVSYITYHYDLKHWDKFKIPEFDRAPEYDGHTSDDVIERLLNL